MLAINIKHSWWLSRTCLIWESPVAKLDFLAVKSVSTTCHISMLCYCEQFVLCIAICHSFSFCSALRILGTQYLSQKHLTHSSTFLGIWFFWCGWYHQWYMLSCCKEFIVKPDWWCSREAFQVQYWCLGVYSRVYACCCIFKICLAYRYCWYIEEILGEGTI
jgi:hypothetical protein